MKIPSDPIGNHTRDILACSSVPHPTAPRRTRRLIIYKSQNSPRCLSRISVSLFVKPTFHEIRFYISPQRNTCHRNTVGYATTKIIGSRISFFVASVRSSIHWYIYIYIYIYIFRGNTFQTHSLEQSYHPTQSFKQEKYNTKSKI